MKPQIAINDIGTAEDFLAAVDASFKKRKIGDTVIGTVVQVGRNGALLDIGGKTEGFIPRSEMTSQSLKEFDPHDIVQIGQELEAVILHRDSESEQYILSIKKSEVEAIWNDLQNKYEISIPVKGEVKKVVKGGLIVDIGEKAFLPGSLVDTVRVSDFNVYVGQQIEAMILNFDRDKRNIVLSRRALLEQIEKEDKQIQFAKLTKGDVKKGTISGIMEYGVFVEIGSLAGLVHKSKMGQLKPDQFIMGQEVEVEIIDIDFEKIRLSLALRG